MFYLSCPLLLAVSLLCGLVDKQLDSRYYVGLFLSTVQCILSDRNHSMVHNLLLVCCSAFIFIFTFISLACSFKFTLKSDITTNYSHIYHLMILIGQLSCCTKPQILFLIRILDMVILPDLF